MIFPSFIYMDIIFGQLHLLMIGTELEAVPADTISFELCIYSYLRASCVHSDRVCRLYSFMINVLLLFECRWSHWLHVRNICKLPSAGDSGGDTESVESSSNDSPPSTQSAVEKKRPEYTDYFHPRK